MSKKYKLTNNTTRKLFNGKPLYKIKALKDFKTVNGILVRAGDFGGYVMSEKNLSQYGNSWIDGYSLAYGNAQILDNAVLCGLSKASGNSMIYDNAVVDSSEIDSNTKIYGNSNVYASTVLGYARIYGNSKVNYSYVYEHAKVHGNAEVKDTFLSGYLNIFDNAAVKNIELNGNANICGNAEIIQRDHLITVGPFGWHKDYITFFRNNEDNISVKYCDFLGDLNDFIKRNRDMRRRWKISNRDAKAYREAARLAKTAISLYGYKVSF